MSIIFPMLAKRRLFNILDEYYATSFIESQVRCLYNP